MISTSYLPLGFASYTRSSPRAVMWSVLVNRYGLLALSKFCRVTQLVKRFYGQKNAQLTRRDLLVAIPSTSDRFARIVPSYMKAKLAHVHECTSTRFLWTCCCWCKQLSAAFADCLLCAAAGHGANTSHRSLSLRPGQMQQRLPNRYLSPLASMTSYLVQDVHT